MGDTLGKAATQISMTDPNHRLWDKAQVIVYLSQTHWASDIIFVGNKEDTLNALVTLIQLQTQYADYMEYILDVLSGSTRHQNQRNPNPVPVLDILESQHPFRPTDNPLPQDASGFCYILVSLQDSRTVYIGETGYLSHQLAQHNSGSGAVQTAPARLRPWALLAYVCGFNYDIDERKHFETLWENEHDRIILMGYSNPMQIASCAQNVIHKYYHNF